jgi:hypothetical protein
LLNKKWLLFSCVQIPANPNDIFSHRYSYFMAPLVKAVQAQQKLIEEQKTIIAQLVQRIEALEKK